MKIVPISNGATALVDDEDFAVVSAYSWNLNDGYAQAPFLNTTIRMHRLIMNAPAGMSVDHIDGDALNNQRSNLRLVTHAENMRNHRIYKTNKSGHSGVFWCERQRNWEAYISISHRRISLGRFKSKAQAIAVRKAAEVEHYGEYARRDIAFEAAEAASGVDGAG